MKLQTFVSKTLVEIMEGLREAQDALKKSHARICPILGSAITEGGNKELIGLTHNNRAISLIAYDIAVEVSQEGEINVSTGALIEALTGGAKAEGDINTGRKSIHRIQFKVPVCYPEKGDE